MNSKENKWLNESRLEWDFIGDQEFLEGKYEFMVLKKGDGFGDNALMKGTPANETIYCNTSWHFAFLSKTKFEEVFRKLEQERKTQWKKFFKGLPAFEHLTLKSIEKLFYFTEVRYFKRNQRIFSQDDAWNGFYIIQQGTAQGKFL